MSISETDIGDEVPGCPSLERLQGGFSWGALLVPQFWYAMHGVWGRAALFWVIIVSANCLFLQSGWEIGLPWLWQSVTWYTIYYGVAGLLARSARLAARRSLPPFGHGMGFIANETFWTVAGLLWIAYDITRLIRPLP